MSFFVAKSRGINSRSAEAPVKAFNLFEIRASTPSTAVFDSSGLAAWPWRSVRAVIDCLCSFLTDAARGTDADGRTG